MAKNKLNEPEMIELQDMSHSTEAVPEEQENNSPVSEAAAESDAAAGEVTVVEKNDGGASRSELLKRLLVDKYRSDKGENDKGGEKTEKKKKSKLETAISIGEQAEAAAGMYDNDKGVVANLGTIGEKLADKWVSSKTGESADEKKDNKEAKKNPDSAVLQGVKELATEVLSDKKSEGEKKTNSDKKDEKPLPIKELAQGVTGAYTSTMKSISSLFAAKKSKSRRNKVRGRIQGVQHMMNAFGGLSGGAGALLKSGQVGSGSDLKIAGDVLSGAVGGFKALSAVMGLIGDKHARTQSKKIAEDAAAFTKDSNKFAKLAESTEEVKRLKETKGTADPEEYERDLAKAKKSRSTAKANKLAMAIASKFNKQKSETSSKGIGDIVTGTAQMLSGAFSATGVASNSAFKNYIGPVISKGSAIAKKMLDARDKTKAAEEKKKAIALKAETIKEYLESKRTKIKEQAKLAAKSSELSDNERDVMAEELTDEESDKIALARLGVSITDMSSDKPATEAELMSGFDYVIMRRAQNIMSSENKDELLDALMLSHDATAEDVAEALKGE